MDHSHRHHRTPHLCVVSGQALRFTRMNFSIYQSEITLMWKLSTRSGYCVKATLPLPLLDQPIIAPSPPRHASSPHSSSAVVHLIIALS